MTVLAITGPPPQCSRDEYAQHQSATPTSFDQIPPLLHLHLADVRCRVEPALHGLAGDLQESGGQVWVTEQSLSFLSASGSSGLSIPYPSLSLHAVSRSLPPSLQSIAEQSTSTASSVNGSNGAGSYTCLYCQLDLSANEDGQGEEEDEEDYILQEFWLLPSKQDDVTPLFDAVSRCASLHPPGGIDDDGSHPFASIGPFGTGAPAEDGAFDDAPEEEGGETELSDTGRANLLRFESMLAIDSAQEDGEEEEAVHTSASGDVEGSAPPTNTLHFTSLPPIFFETPELQSSLLDLLHAYGPLRSYTAWPSVGGASVVYEDKDDAALAKTALDHLLLPLGDDEDGEEGPTLRAYYGPDTPLPLTSSLEVPVTDKNFLISPPGSPPVGWEPIREDPPNRDTLADDLMRALGALRDGGSHLASSIPAARQEDATDALSTSTALPPPTLVIPPSSAPLLTLRSRQGLAGDAAHVSIPGVTVQSYDPVDAHELEGSSGIDAHVAKVKGVPLSITGVKATVESLRGTVMGDEAGKRITPTGRPPLA